MSNLLECFISDIIITPCNIYIWIKLLNKKLDFKSLKTYIIILCMFVVTLLNYLYNNQFIRILTITGFMAVCIKILFNEKINKAILTSIMCQFIYMLAETVYALVLSLILGPDLEKILDFSLGKLVTNVSIVVIIYLFLKIPIIKKLFYRALVFVEKINYKYVIILSFFLMAVANVFAMTTYFEINFTVLLVFNVIMTLICCSIIIYSFVTENNYNKVSDKYNVAINSLKDYEDMMTRYRVLNHENKNLLLTVRGMIINKEKQIPKYIDSIIEEKYSDDDKLLFKTSVIPTGGLRATIYSEILKIQKNKIDYNLDIDRKIRTIDLIELDTNAVIDICKIIGVFIDNAIEEVKKLKTRNINISLYITEGLLNIKVSNNYSGKIDVEKIYDEGYSTKGKGHGYGLSLVKNIVNQNSLFENSIEINRNTFSQVLSIKYKKQE